MENFRLCEVSGKAGYFHMWEQHFSVIGPSYSKFGHPGGQIGSVYGIVEFSDGVRRVDPMDIEFCDEIHARICSIQEKLDKEKNHD